LAWCENITDASVVDLLTKCNKISTLNLRQVEVTAITFRALAKHGHNITNIGLCGLKGKILILINIDLSD
jgi:hypothetical protein